MYKLSKSISATFLTIILASANVFALTPREKKFVEDFAEKIGVSSKDFIFDVDVYGRTAEERTVLKENLQCALVPIHDVEEHVKCMKEIFANTENSDYMKYYLDGKIVSEDVIGSRVRHSERRMNEDIPKSFTFIITCGDEFLGRLAVGPLMSRTPEIGYVIKKEYSGKGITKAAVRCLLDLLGYIKDREDYKIERIRATAKVDNIASNSILLGLGFEKSEELVDDGYGKENEYFYYF